MKTKGHAAPKTAAACADREAPRLLAHGTMLGRQMRRRWATAGSTGRDTGPLTTNPPQRPETDMTTIQLTATQHAILAYATDPPTARSTGSPTP